MTAPSPRTGEGVRQGNRKCARGRAQHDGEAHHMDKNSPTDAYAYQPPTLVFGKMLEFLK